MNEHYFDAVSLPLMVLANIGLVTLILWLAS